MDVCAWLVYYIPHYLDTLAQIKLGKDIGPSSEHSDVPSELGKDIGPSSEKTSVRARQTPSSFRARISSGPRYSITPEVAEVIPEK